MIVNEGEEPVLTAMFDEQNRLKKLDSKIKSGMAGPG